MFGECAFVISDSTETLDQFAPMLLKGHRGLQDWVLSRKPLLVIPVWDNNKTGGVLRDLSLISPTKIPKSTARILCFNLELGKLIAPDEPKLFTPLFFEVLGDKEKLMEWAVDEGLLIGGVELKPMEGAG